MVRPLTKEQEKLEAIEQKKQRLQQQAQALKASVRRKENALKYAHGGLIKKAGLAELFEDQLLGLLLEQHERLSRDQSVLQTWEAKTEAQSTKAKKQPVVIKFETTPTDDMTAQLKDHKLRWNRFAKHWEGDISLEALEQIEAVIGEAPITRIEP